MEALKFLNSWTITNFKNKLGVESIDIKRNPKTNSLFFVWGPGRGEIGAVTSKINGDLSLLKKPIISEVEGEEGTFYLLHNEGEGVETLASF